MTDLPGRSPDWRRQSREDGAKFRILYPARLISRVAVSDDPREDIKRTDIDSTALVAHSLAIRPSSPGTVALISDRPGRIELRTAAPAGQLLALTETYDPGWRGYVDDRPASVEQVNGDFLGCVVPEGSHQVRFEFAPRCMLVGKVVSLASVVFTGLLVGIALRYRRRESPIC